MQFLGLIAVKCSEYYAWGQRWAVIDGHARELKRCPASTHRKSSCESRLNCGKNSHACKGQV